jgi:NADH dehydrogenase [ubiquinone] 1 alpha subcomplex assembly factor 7
VDRPSPLESEIRKLIAATGPMPIVQYMTLCLTHPRYGYYMTRDPFGATGDFTTAPEISQMFGELIGLWAIGIWRLMGSPPDIRLVELGPGRGTMMRDALRAAKVQPEFRKAAVVHLIEISPSLERLQEENLSDLDVPVYWHGKLEDVPEGPVIILANEFLDALPVQQVVKQASGWHQRTIEIDAAGNFAFGLAPDPLPQFERILPSQVRDAPVGAIYEWRADNIMFEIGRRIMRFGGAALIIDYGHAQSATGDTLQSVGEHAFTDPLSSPGMVDVTAHVDFQAAAQAAENMGARAHGPIEQREFLRRLGIDARAAALKKMANAEKSADIDAALARLTGDGRTGMGELFKVMAIADPKLGLPPGFDS